MKTIYSITIFQSVTCRLYFRTDVAKVLCENTRNKDFIALDVLLLNDKRNCPEQNGVLESFDKMNVPQEA
jgi:hypothetical protein